MAAPDARTLYVACAGANEVLVLDLAQRRITRRLPLPGPPSGLALTANGARLFVTCASPASQVCILDTGSGKMLQQLAAGHTALSPVLSRDEKMLFVCNRFNDAVSVFNLKQNKEVARIPVPREPVSAVLTRGGRYLLVANHLPQGRSDLPYVAAAVSVIDVSARKVAKTLRLENGSINLRQMSVSPDGRYACVPQTVGRFQLPVTQIARGWVNANALALIDLASLEVITTVLLDDPERGAANPWATAWSPDGHWLCVTHAGTHEVSLIDFPALLSKLSRSAERWRRGDAETRRHGEVEVDTDLSFLGDLRYRVKLQGNGPRALAFVGKGLYVANYFSDSLDVLDLATWSKTCADAPPRSLSNKPASAGCSLPSFGGEGRGEEAPHASADIRVLPDKPALLAPKEFGAEPTSSPLPSPPKEERAKPPRARNADVTQTPWQCATVPKVESLRLNPGYQPTVARRGEMYFNDATLCFQGWQSCASCHDDDGRVDGLNWDLLNDGIGNPKDTKSLVLSHQTPPVMSLGVRANASAAVRNGIQNSLAAAWPEEIPAAMDEWLKSLEPAPSPRLVDGKLSDAAQRGEKLFQSPNTGCAACHTPGLFTDLHSYNVGTQSPFDKQDKEFDTPTLRELWRTAPYLHDGSAATLREALTTHNPKDEHGKISHLSPAQLDDLIEYLLSL